jgi:SulP family sulfate permease
MHLQNEEITLTPFKQDIERYSWDTFRYDLGAALVVALVTVPQALAYSLIAGLPLSCGLLSAIFATTVAALFGSSRQLVVGPSSAISLLILYATSDIMFTHFRGVGGPEREILAVQILTQLALMVGLMQILAAIFKLGRLTQFVSYSVIVAYLACTSFAVIVNQLFIFTGISAPLGMSSLYEKAVYLITNMPDIHIPTTLVGLFGLLFLLVIKRMNPKLPAAVIMLLIIGFSVHFLGLSSYSETGLLHRYTESQIGNVTLVGDAGDIQGMLPRLRFPSFNTSLMNNLLPYAFAIALLSILETTSFAKSLAASSGQRLSINQEILGLGMGNLASSFFGGLLCSGSPTRSFLNYKNGAKTRFAAILSSFFVLLIVLSMGYFLMRTPLPALSAIILVGAVNIVNSKQFFACLKATSSDAMVIMMTVMSCLFFSLDIAFYTGIITSITFYLKKASMPQLVECSYDESGKIGSLDEKSKQKHRLIRILNVQGELFFGAADLFQSTLKSMAEDDTTTKVIILRLKNARDIDATACLAILQLHEFLKDSGRYLLACGLSHHSWHILCNAGVVDAMGKENLFILNDQKPNETLQRAIYRANQLIMSGKVPEQTAAPETLILKASQV